MHDLLTYEELLTVVQVEMTFNSRPLSFISSEYIEEPLTPSYLFCGHRILSLSDPMLKNEEDNHNTSTSGTENTICLLEEVEI
jgi:hypothetical protein